jgi:hypothetical protein
MQIGFNGLAYYFNIKNFSRTVHNPTRKFYENQGEKNLIIIKKIFFRRNIEVSLHKLTIYHLFNLNSVTRYKSLIFLKNTIVDIYKTHVTIQKVKWIFIIIKSIYYNLI